MGDMGGLEKNARQDVLPVNLIEFQLGILYIRRIMLGFQF